MGDHQARFTMQRDRWYAAEFIGDEFGPEFEFRSHSPIRVDQIEPAKSGQRTFQLGFHHSNYPQGVQHKVYTLQTIERGEHFILARSTDHNPPRLLLIYEISWAWLSRHFEVQQGSGREDVQRWLENHG